MLTKTDIAEQKKVDIQFKIYFYNFKILMNFFSFLDLMENAV